MGTKDPEAFDNVVIRPSLKPISKQLAYCEKVIGSRSPDVQNLMALIGGGRDKKIMIRYTPTKEQRRVIADGGDIYICLQSFGNPMAPMVMFTGNDLDPANVVEYLELDIPFGVLGV